MTNLTRRPNVGDRVLYVSYGTPGGEYSSVCRAAIVTSVGAWITISDSAAGTPDRHPVAPGIDGAQRALIQEWRSNAVTLCVINPGGIFLNSDQPCQYHTGRDESWVFSGWLPGSWHYPEDEPDA